MFPKMYPRNSAKPGDYIKKERVGGYNGGTLAHKRLTFFRATQPSLKKSAEQRIIEVCHQEVNEENIKTL